MSTQLTASTASAITMSVRRGTRFVSAESGTVRMTTVVANTVTSRPMSGSLTPRSRLMSGSSPVGIISIVTERNTAAASTSRPTQGKGGALAGPCGGMGVTGVDDVMGYLSGRASPAGAVRVSHGARRRVDCAPMCAPRAAWKGDRRQVYRSTSASRLCVGHYGAMPILNKDMQVCISLAGRPSNLGTRFHNFLYDELGLNFIYKAFTTDDIEGAVRGIRALGIRGCSVSMPFKEAVIPLVDVVEQSAAAIESVNTIVNDDGVLTASNTDYEAIAMLIAEHGLDPDQRVLVRGSGGMAKAVVAAFRGAGFDDLSMRRAQRRRRTGPSRRSTGTTGSPMTPRPGRPRSS